MSGGGGVPFWLVTNEKRQVLTSKKGISVGGGSTEALIDHLIDKSLGLSDYI